MSLQTNDQFGMVFGKVELTEIAFQKDTDHRRVRVVLTLDLRSTEARDLVETAIRSFDCVTNRLDLALSTKGDVIVIIDTGKAVTASKLKNPSAWKRQERRNDRFARQIVRLIIATLNDEAAQHFEQSQATPGDPLLVAATSSHGPDYLNSPRSVRGKSIR